MIEFHSMDDVERFAMIEVALLQYDINKPNGWVNELMEKFERILTDEILNKFDLNKSHIPKLVVWAYLGHDAAQNFFLNPKIQSIN